MSNFLEVVGLSINFGGLYAVSNLDFTVEREEIVGIIGPNGAGKTTLFNLLTGFLVPTEGNVIFKGKSMVRRKPHQIVDRGISRTFQLVRPFQQMSVLENVMVPHLSPKKKRKNKGRAENQRQSARILDQVGLGDKMHLLAADLSHGDLRRLELARALAAEPELLLLDEPFSGLASKEIEVLLTLIRGVSERGLTIIVIEHKLRELMKLVKRVITLNFGKKIADGTPQEIARNEAVIKAYLGKGGKKFVSS
ncbi:MAG: ABC transporter ATP-binding protein [Deltaproteobacteria bacterium]|nr:ABC transporter ATP-binding protein [Deltaproteobacteria bacterium]